MATEQLVELARESAVPDCSIAGKLQAGGCSGGSVFDGEAPSASPA